MGREMEAGNGAHLEIICPCGASYVKTRERLELRVGIPRVIQQYVRQDRESEPWAGFCRQHHRHLHKCGRCQLTGWDWSHGKFNPCCVLAAVLGEGMRFGVTATGEIEITMTECSLPPETAAEQAADNLFLIDGHDFRVPVDHATEVRFTGDVAGVLGAYQLDKSRKAAGAAVKPLDDRISQLGWHPTSWIGWHVWTTLVKEKE